MIIAHDYHRLVIERNLNYFFKDSSVNICPFATMGAVTTVIQKMLLINKLLFLSSVGDLKYTVYFSLKSVEFLQ